MQGQVIIDGFRFRPEWISEAPGGTKKLVMKFVSDTVILDDGSQFRNLVVPDKDPGQDPFSGEAFKRREEAKEFEKYGETAKYLIDGKWKPNDKKAKALKGLLKNEYLIREYIKFASGLR